MKASSQRSISAARQRASTRSSPTATRTAATSANQSNGSPPITASHPSIYPGIGFNLPGGGPDDPEAIYQCVTKAFDAGASGIVVSREYEELTVPNLKEVGRAVRDRRT